MTEMYSAPVVSVFVMRDAIVRAGVGSSKDAQDLSRNGLEELWCELWREARESCLDAIRWEEWAKSTHE